MALTNAQLVALKADILARPELAADWAGGADQSIANFYNATANPAFIVWRTSVQPAEIMANGFVWTEIDALGVGKARIWEWMQALGSINPSKANVRQGLRDAFPNATAPNTFAGIQPHLKRTATLGEKLFATGTGSDASPATMTFEGVIDDDDVSRARLV